MCRLKPFFPRLHTLETEKCCCVADRIRWTADSAELSWKWQAQPKWRAESELIELSEKIKAYIPSGNHADSWAWKYQYNGIYTSCSLVKLINDVSTDGRNTSDPTVLNPLLPQKLSIFIWRAIKNKLPVRTELDKRGIDLHSTRCSICDDDIESLHHILFTCKTASVVWEKIRKWWNINNLYLNNLPDLAKASHPSFPSAPESSIWQAVIWVACYLIWKNRNDHVFGKNPVSPPKMVSDIQVKCFEWINCRGKKLCLDWLAWLSDPIHSFRIAPSKEGIG
ncbi:uncharacterized protein [Rutidosis leptorrhynchoides]|uniref:uncharacterized protein n=1 Tax=Rutidosis leptorrhynchoides TaxID=125765 RepID=UPI003A9A348D